MRQADHNAKILLAPATELTSICNTILSTFFTMPVNGNFTMTAPLRGTVQTQSGNLILTFKQNRLFIMLTLVLFFPELIFFHTHAIIAEFSLHNFRPVHCVS